MPIYVVLKSLGLLGSAPAREFFGPARNGDRRSIAEKMTWAEPPKFGRAIALWGLNKIPNNPVWLCFRVIGTRRVCNRPDERHQAN